jgi:alanine racemase
MNRLGLRPDEAAALAESGLLTRFRPSLMMSHLACADEPGNALNARQLERFRRVRALFPDVPASLANSAGILSGPDFAFDLVRPGIALYGAEAVEGRSPLRPVVTLEAPILQIREAAPGETVGYGATQTLRRPTRLAILSLGYADGYLRAASSSDSRRGAEAAVAGRRAPLVGRVSMDLTAVDVTDIPDAARGTLVELIGPTIPVDEVARAAGTIGYEVLTRLGNRLIRHYVQ